MDKQKYIKEFDKLKDLIRNFSIADDDRVISTRIQKSKIDLNNINPDFQKYIPVKSFLFQHSEKIWRAKMYFSKPIESKMDSYYLTSFDKKTAKNLKSKQFDYSMDIQRNGKRKIAYFIQEILLDLIVTCDAGEQFCKELKKAFMYVCKHDRDEDYSYGIRICSEDLKYRLIFSIQSGTLENLNGNEILRYEKENELLMNKIYEDGFADDGYKKIILFGESD